MKYLLDTNIISELGKKKAHPALFSWFNSLPPDRFFLCVMTIGELRKGIELKRSMDANAAIMLENWLDGVEKQYKDRIIDFDRVCAHQWGSIIASARHIAKDHVIDTQIAAIAVTHKCVMVTRNAKHFTGIVPDVINPFELVH